MMRTDKLFGLVGIGIFLILTLNSIGFLVSKILEELLLFTDLSPLLTYGLSVYIALIVVLLVFVLTLKKIQHLENEKSHFIKKLFLVAFFAYVTTQLVAFMLPFIAPLYETTMYYDLKEFYHITLNENFALKQLAIDTPQWIIQYTFIAIIILKEIKPFTKIKHT